MKIKDISWYEANNGYICHKNTGKKVILLHRLIMNAPKDKVVDHINHNVKDNRKNNLRLVSQKVNTLNKKKKPKGIFKNKVGNNKYYIVQLNGYRGNFKTYKEAKKLRDEIIRKEYNNEEKLFMKNNFINQCLKQLKQERVCYVYTEQQKDEVLNKCNIQNIEVKQNECGYTIKVIRKKVNKNE